MSIYNIMLVTNNTTPTTPEPTETIIRLVDTYPLPENRVSAVFATFYILVFFVKELILLIIILYSLLSPGLFVHCLHIQNIELQYLFVIIPTFIFL